MNSRLRSARRRRSGRLALFVRHPDQRTLSALEHPCIAARLFLVSFKTDKIALPPYVRRHSLQLRKEHEMQILFILIGVFLLGVGIYMRKKSTEAQSWPSTNGIIIESEARIIPGISGLSLTVKYIYRINDIDYESNKISWAGHSGSDKAARDLEKKYLVNKSVCVYYDPKDPSNAVLENNTNNIWMYVVLTGVAFSMIGIIWILG